MKTIDGLNMHAIVLKNDATHTTVNKATLGPWGRWALLPF